MNTGRPRFLDDAKRRDVIALLSQGTTIQTAAAYIGCSPRTLHRELIRDKQFHDQVRTACASCQLTPLHSLSNAARTNWRAAAWMLERIYPRHFGRRRPDFVEVDDACEVI